MVDVIQAALAPLADSVRLVLVYGSIARGEETATSDIGLLVSGSPDDSSGDRSVPQHDSPRPEPVRRTPGLSPDWSLNIAYSAVLQAARAALAAAGYRAPTGEGHHYVVLQSLAHTIGLDPGSVHKLDALRKRRHMATYTRAGTVSDREARDAIALIERVGADVETWLKKAHPELLAD